jgi:hypothetical protein
MIGDPLRAIYPSSDWLNIDKPQQSAGTRRSDKKKLKKNKFQGFHKEDI